MLVFIVLMLCLVQSTSRLSKGLGTNDLSLHLYTEDGQVAQLAYAQRAVSRCQPRFGFFDDDTGRIALFSVTKLPPRLVSAHSFSIDVANEGAIVCLTAGYQSDCTYLLNHKNILIQTHCLTYGEPPNLDSLGSELSEWMTRGMYMQREDPLSRPLAASLLIAAHDRDLKRNRLMQVDNSGYISDRRLSMLGSLSDKDKVDLCSAVMQTAAGTAGDTGDKEEREQEDGSQNSKKQEEAWLRKCEKCASILLHNRDESEDFGLDCCVLDTAGSVHRPPQTLVSVQDTITWIRSTISS